MGSEQKTPMQRGRATAPQDGRTVGREIRIGHDQRLKIKQQVHACLSCLRREAAIGEHPGSDQLFTYRLQHVTPMARMRRRHVLLPPRQPGPGNWIF